MRVIIIKQKECTLTIYINTLYKIIEILQQYTESLNSYDDIEEIINIIHFLQEEAYKQIHGDE